MRDLLAFLMPAEASAYSHQVDIFALAFLSLVIALSAPVFILITAFAVKYRRGKEANRVHPPQKSAWMEISWAAIPFLCLLGFFAWATALFATRYAPPADALTIDVVVKQWMWKFQHPEGQGEIDELHVPVGRPVKLVMASQDVIHSLYIPSLRLKQDVVPGRYTTMWFTADRPGVFGLACAEFCGTDHSVMGGKFIALDAADYSRWLERAPADETLAVAGAKIFRARGCSGCHGPSATVHAPRLEGLYGRAVPLASGEIVTADTQYIRDSILLPHKQVAAGYPDIMPTFANTLSEEELLMLVAYIQSLGGEDFDVRAR